MSTFPRLWVRRFLIISNLQPMTIIREVRLHKGLNIIWGKGSDEDGTIDLLAGHSVGKTLFCRLLRYGLGEDSYAAKDFQRDIEAILPGAYVGLEVVVEGRTWAVARPLYKVEPANSGKKKQPPRHDYALPDVTIEELLREQQKLNFSDYQRALDSLTEACQPAGLRDDEERPFRWTELLQWVARDQETRFQDLTYWRSPRSRTGTALESDGSDLLMRCTLGLVDADEARLVVKLRNSVKRLKEAKGKNEAARKAMWAIVNQISLRYTNMAPQQPSEDEIENMLLGAPNVLRSRLEKLQAQIDREKTEYQVLDHAEIAAQEAWDAIEKQALLYEAQLRVQGEALGEVGASLRDLEFIKEFLANSGDQLCAYCDKFYAKNDHIQDRLAQEDELRQADDAKRIQILNQREEQEEVRREALDRLSPNRDELRRKFELAQTAKAEKRNLLDDLIVDMRVVKRELNDIERNLAGARAAQNNRADAKSPIPIEDLEELSREIELYRNRLNQIREAQTQQLDEIRSAFDRVVQGVLNQHFTGVIEVKHGHLRFGLETGRGQRGEAVETLTVLLADLCTLVLGIEETVTVPGLLIHDSPREADIQPNVYNKIFEYAEQLSNAVGRESAPFQYLITTTTPPPENLAGTDRVVLELSAASDDQLLLGRRVLPRSSKV